VEEAVGALWHRLVTRAADASHADAAVTLASMQRCIAVLFRAAGGDAALRITSGGEQRHGGPRGWWQRLAGSGTQAGLPELDASTLALPPVLAVFDDAALNRDLYLWLAAQAACHVDTGAGWLADNAAATQRALGVFPGLAARHAALLRAQLAMRPAPAALRGAAREAERQVQAVLRGAPVPAEARGLDATRVAPVWLWVGARAAPEGEGPRPAPGAPRPAAAAPLADARRRRAERLDDPTQRNGMVMPFRAESLLSWSEMVRINRATDDEDDGRALAAADDLSVLSIAPDGAAAAARVRFDLDLPSASADDLPLGPGERLPEWDCRRAVLVPDRVAAQVFVAREAAPFVPGAPLRATARRVRRRLEGLRAAPRWQRGEPSGEAIDLDAWVRWRSDVLLGGEARADPAVYARATRGERSLATLLLADLSLSTDAYATPDARVIDVIRESLHVFGEALAGCGDAFEMTGFSSVRRDLRLHRLKAFDEPWSRRVRDRIGAVKPGYYTRLGAAIRHATGRLARRPERQRLLLILTDGKPNDLDAYEGRHGLEDTREAVREARAAGLVPFCVTIDEAAHGYLPHLFGSGGWTLVHRPAQLVARLAQVYARLTR